ncbi:hypothetical protein ACVWZV_007851 [Bradyrhizobium sp. GM5.1]
MMLMTVFDSFGYLPDRQRRRRAQADQQDQQADDDRQDRAFDENISKAHRGDLDFFDLQSA